MTDSSTPHYFPNPWNVVVCLQNCFAESERTQTVFTSEEEDLALKLYGLIATLVNDKQFEVITTESLTLQYSSGFEDGDPDTGILNDAGLELYDCQPEGKESSIIPIQYKKQAVEYWRNKGGKQRTFESVKNRFKKLKQRCELNVWEQQVEEGGTAREKYKYIFEKTFEDFHTTRVLGNKHVHDVDLQRWALKHADRVGAISFRASRSWLHKFKEYYRIVSRKITKFVTRHHKTDEADLVAKSVCFVGEVSPLIEMHGPNCVLNTDQCGFQLEFHSERTLNPMNEKIVYGEIQSKNSLTHSYTVQPIISAAGELIPVLLVVLKEKDGKFGPRVAETMFTSENLYVVASKSGKLTKAIFQEWLCNVYFPNVPRLTVLLLDSWSTQSENNVLACKPNDKDIIVKTIPQGTTGMIQPLDVYGFRIWKNFVRTFNDAVIVYDFQVNIHLRDNILKIQALAHNQLSSPRFREMWKYSFYKTGYTVVKPLNFPHPVEYCFRSAQPDDICGCCDVRSMGRCSWCKKTLCIEHYFVNPHLCNEFKE